MKRTDYEKIAACYDKGAYRQAIKVDQVILDVLAATHRTLHRGLEIGCGTANYLVVQEQAFRDCAVAWHGIDPSAAMLAVAQHKTCAILTRGRGEQLPFRDDSFDFVTIHFAWHHLTDKDMVVCEIARILRPKGVVRMFNFDPYQSTAWWVYRWFPGTFEDDRKRFWRISAVEAAFGSHGIELTTSAHPYAREVLLADLYTSAANRDISHLANLPDEKFLGHLAAMKAACRADPGRVVRDEMMLVECLGRRGIDT